VIERELSGKRFKDERVGDEFSPLAFGEKPFEKGSFPMPLFPNFSLKR